MTLRSKLAGALGAVLIVATGAAAAAAVVTTVFTNDNFSYASYVQVSADGCQAMALEVFASRSMTRSNDNSRGGPVSYGGPRVHAQVSAYNYCTGVFTFMSGANESPTLFTNRDLSLSTASAVVDMQDEFGTIRTLVIDLSWRDGALAADKERTKIVFTSPRSRTLIRSTGSVRYSETVSGSLVLDGLDLLGPDNGQMQSYSFISGFVTSSKGSSIDIIRY